MFVVLDTNHFAELVHDTALGGRLKARFQARKAQVFTTIIIRRINPDPDEQPFHFFFASQVCNRNVAIVPERLTASSA